VEPTEHIVHLTQIEANCTAADNPQTVATTVGQTVQVAFVVTCSGVGDSTGIRTADLGGMPGADGWTTPTSLAGNGSIAGWAEFGRRLRAFHRTPTGVWTNLNSVSEEATGLSHTSAAWDMSENERVVGVIDINAPRQQPVLWQELDGVWTVVELPIAHPNGPARGGFARAISRNGQIIAGYTIEDCGTTFCAPVIPVVWIERDGLWEIEFLPFDGTTQGIPEAVSDEGEGLVAGHIDNDRAVVWTKTGEIWSVDVLPTPPGYGGRLEGGLNRLGDVAGQIFNESCPDFTTPAAWFRAGSSWKLVEIADRRLCDSSDPTGFATDVSDSREVVGALSLSGQRAFLWRAGRLQLQGAGSAAWTINESGQFAGSGSEHRHALLWTLE
jgi:hypothetical protein